MRSCETGSSGLNEEWDLTVRDFCATFSVAVVVLLVLLRGDVLLSALIGDLSGLALQLVEACEPAWFACGENTFRYPPVAYGGNRGALKQISQLLDKAIQLDPNSRSGRLRLAEASFALGDREKAAELLAPWLRSSVLRWPADSLVRRTAGQKLKGAPSILLFRPRYEHYLVLGVYYAHYEQWDKAVEAYRYGLALGAERTLSVDEQGFFLALAALHQKQATEHADGGRAAYLTGKYLARAQQWKRAITWLRRALQPNRKVDLRQEEQGRAYTYLGWASEKSGQFEAARKAYKAAIDADPSLAVGYVRLLTLLRRLGNEEVGQEVETQLAALEPPYILGRQGEGYEVRQPTALADGWTLLGYDVDEEALEAGAPLDLLLWWEGPEGEQPKGESWVRAGNGWLQWQHVLNLAPNAGFEWGAQENGLPIGYVREVYGAVPGSVSVQVRRRSKQMSNVLVLDNSASDKVGIEACPTPVASNELYLMAGWKWDAGSGNIGRLCGGPDSPRAPYYVAHLREDEPRARWLHFADLNEPQPGRKVTTCSTFLLNYQTHGLALWDNIVLARLMSPEA